MRAVQTPQGFTVGILRRAHEVAGAEADTATDDASLVERLGADVMLVDGHPAGFKITRLLDLQAAELIVAADRRQR